MDRSVSILHVDDDRSLRDLTATVLERENDHFTVETAASADEAFDSIDECSPDCIVSDYSMPGMDGIEFLQAVREEYPTLPFILFTGEGGEAVASEAIAADVTDYLQKGAGLEKYELLANRIGNGVRARRETQRANKQEGLMRLTEFAGDTGGFEMDVDTGEVLLTDGAERILGPAKDTDLTLETAIERFHPEDREALRQTIESACETGEQTAGTWRYRPSEGDRRLLNVTFTVAPTNGDGITLRGVIHDITDREERRCTLEQTETLFEHAYDTLFLVGVGEQFTIERVNPAIEQATGMSPTEIRGQTPKELFGDQQGEVVEARYRECIERREPLEYEEQLVFGEQPTHWKTRIAPVPVDGTVEYIAGSSRDVTGRKEQQRELREEQQFVQSIFRSLPDPLYAVDTDGYPIRWNERLETVTGYSADEVQNMHVTDLVPSDEADTIAAKLQMILEERQTVTVESALEMKDGTRIPYEFTGGPLETPDGTLRGVTGVGREITGHDRHLE